MSKQTVEELLVKSISPDKDVARLKFADLLLAEYRYWKSQDNPDIDGITIGAIGALSNVLAALYGHKPEHHD